MWRFPNSHPLAVFRLLVAVPGLKWRKVHEEDPDRWSLHLAGQSRHAETSGQLAQACGHHQSNATLIGQSQPITHHCPPRNETKVRLWIWNDRQVHYVDNDGKQGTRKWQTQYCGIRVGPPVHPLKTSKNQTSTRTGIHFISQNTVMILEIISEATFLFQCIHTVFLMIIGSLVLENLYISLSSHIQSYICIFTTKTRYNT